MSDVSFADKMKIGFDIVRDYLRIEFSHDPIWTLSVIISPFIFMGILVYNLMVGGIFMFGAVGALKITFNVLVLFLMAAFSFIITMMVTIIVIFAGCGCMIIYDQIKNMCLNVHFEYRMRKDKLIKARSKKV